jgi:hypothetical protein
MLGTHKSKDTFWGLFYPISHQQLKEKAKEV